MNRSADVTQEPKRATHSPPLARGEAAPTGARSRWHTWAEPLALGLLALVVRAAQLDHAPFVDELNHLMAAQSLLAEGSLRLADGAEYVRAAPLTFAIAGLFAAFGESLVAARIPALIAGVALVVAVFIWLRAADSRLSAWGAALLLCFSPAAIYFSQQARFYSIQQLVFFIGAVAVFHLIGTSVSDRRRAALLLSAAMTCLLAAAYFQASSVVGITVLGGWAAVAYLLASRARGDRAPKPLLVTLGVLAALSLALVLMRPGLLPSGLMLMATRADSWAGAHVGNVRYYHDHFFAQYAVLWALLPLFTLLALLRRARVALFASLLFFVPLVLHSLLAWKHERYIAYAVPFLFIVMGLGLAQVAGWLFTELRTWILLAARGRLSGRQSAVVAVVLSAAAALLPLRANQAFTYARELILAPEASWTHEIAYRGESDWRLVEPVLSDRARSASIVISSAELKAMYYFGRLDLLLSRDFLSRRGMVPSEFAVLPKLNRAVISTPESLDRVMRCYPSGLVLVEERHWRVSWAVTPETASLLEAASVRVAVPHDARLHAFTWSTTVPTAEDCGSVRAQVEVW